MLQRGGVWLVGVAVVVGCGGPREAPLVDGGGSSRTDAQGDGPVDADSPASNGPGATDIANVGALTRQHAFVPHLVHAGVDDAMREDARRGDQHRDVSFARLAVSSSATVTSVLRVPGGGVQ